MREKVFKERYVLLIFIVLQSGSSHFNLTKINNGTRVDLAPNSRLLSKYVEDIKKAFEDVILL